jgi:hypothetical protein
MCQEEMEIRNYQHQVGLEAHRIPVVVADIPSQVDYLLAFLLVLEEAQMNLVAVDYMEDCLRLRQDS